jgi:hypothetical protein
VTTCFEELCCSVHAPTRLGLCPVGVALLSVRKVLLLLLLLVSGEAAATWRDRLAGEIDLLLVLLLITWRVMSSYCLVSWRRRRCWCCCWEFIEPGGGSCGEFIDELVEEEDAEEEKEAGEELRWASRYVECFSMAEAVAAGFARSTVGIRAAALLCALADWWFALLLSELFDGKSLVKVFSTDFLNFTEFIVKALGQSRPTSLKKENATTAMNSKLKQQNWINTVFTSLHLNYGPIKNWPVKF